MVKDKVIQMDNGKNYYVLEEVEYNNKKYILTLECNLEQDTINEEDYLVMQLDIKNEDLHIKKITDNNIATIVTTMLLNKIKNS